MVDDSSCINLAFSFFVTSRFLWLWLQLSLACSSRAVTGSVSSLLPKDGALRCISLLDSCTFGCSGSKSWQKSLGVADIDRLLDVWLVFVFTLCGSLSPFPFWERLPFCWTPPSEPTHVLNALLRLRVMSWTLWKSYPWQRENWLMRRAELHFFVPKLGSDRICNWWYRNVYPGLYFGMV